MTTTEASRQEATEFDEWDLYDGIRVSVVDFPAIRSDQDGFAGYLQEQANYYLSLDSEFAHKLAEILAVEATRIIHRGRQ